MTTYSTKVSKVFATAFGLISAASLLIGAANVSASSYVFNANLTVGSRGAGVTALQNIVGINPATGYFGSLTKTAVVKWQKANGVSPASGFVGPLTRKALNNASVVTTSVSTTTTSASPTVTTKGNGVEGILTVNINPTPSSGQNVYAGDTKDALIGIKLQAQLSPINIQRVQVDLGDNFDFSYDFFQTLYLVGDNGQVLSTIQLSTDTVTKQTNVNGGYEYYATFSGFNYTVPGDNSVHVLTVEGDAYNAYDSSYDGVAVAIGVDANGVRGIDGAGVSQYGPTTNSFDLSALSADNWDGSAGNGSGLTGIGNTITIQDSLSDNATLQLSTDSATPLAGNAVASQGSGSNELDGQTLLVFDLYAQKDFSQLDNLTAHFIKSGTGNATATTAYLFAGGKQISSAAVDSTGAATFTNINYKISENTTVPFTVKADIKNANSSSAQIYATIDSSDVLAENSMGDSISLASSNLTGSATGNSLTVNSAGAVFALASTPTITTQVSSSQNNTSTTTALASFVVQIQAVGGNAYFGTQAASSTFGFSIYQGGNSGRSFKQLHLFSCHELGYSVNRRHHVGTAWK